MIKQIKMKWMLGLLCAATVGAVNPAHAAGTVPPTLNSESSAVQAKILVVDKTERTITVEVKGKLYLYKLTKGTKFLKDGKEIKIEDLAAGQEILLATREQDGGFEVVSVTIGGSQAAAEAAGKEGKERRNGPPGPIGNPGNAGNAPGNGPPIVSPYN